MQKDLERSVRFAAMRTFLAPWTQVLGADAVVVAGGIAAAFALFGPALAAGLVGAAEALNGAMRRVVEPHALKVG